MPKGDHVRTVPAGDPRSRRRVQHVVLEDPHARGLDIPGVVAAQRFKTADPAQAVPRHARVHRASYELDADDLTTCS